MSIRMLGCMVVLAAALPAAALTPVELRDEFAAKAGSPPSAERGQQFFVRKFGRDFENCAECHGAVPTGPGKDLVSSKSIAPLAPAANSSHFSEIQVPGLPTARTSMCAATPSAWPRTSSVRWSTSRPSSGLARPTRPSPSWLT